jgi:DNA invertase Pin-like site-specific DNA recombinase
MSDKKPTRDIGAARLSRRTDESTAIPRQRERITYAIKARGDTLVTITEDDNTSGEVSPFERDDLGPWLTDPDKMRQWDCLVVTKLDRLTRSLRHFDELVDWLDRHGKTLVVIDDNIDLSTSIGRMGANMVAMFAQFERERIAERRRERAEDDRARGWWSGGGYNYGLRPVKVNGHWELEIDPDTYHRLEDIAYSLIDGSSASSIAKRLDTLGVPTPRGSRKWRQNTIRDMFTHEKCPLDADLLDRVLLALDRTKTPWTKRGDAAALLNVAYCECGAVLYSKRYTSKGHFYEYYDCSAHCGSRRIPMEDAERAVDDIMTDVEQLSPDDFTGFGWTPVIDKTVKAGKSHKKEILALERRIRTVPLGPDWRQKTDELHAQWEQLTQLDETQRELDETTYDETGLILADYWRTLTPEEKREFMLHNGIKFAMGRRTGSNYLNVEYIGPEMTKVIRMMKPSLAA